MTVQCEQVMAECDLPEGDWRRVELLLLKHSPSQISRLMWNKDPEGVHDLEWFKLFFANGYVKQVVFMDLDGPPDDQFWAAVSWMEQVVDDRLSSKDLPHIWRMSRDERKMRVAVGKSTIKNVAYIHKVFQSTVTRQAPESEKVDMTMGHSSVVEIRSIG